MNETYKGYGTRDVLIPGKTSQEAHSDFIPKSIIQIYENMSNLSTMKTKHILKNRMDDLNEVSNTHSYLQFFNNNIRSFEEIMLKMNIYE